jgi:hypothetical protein
MFPLLEILDLDKYLWLILCESLDFSRAIHIHIDNPWLYNAFLGGNIGLKDVSLLNYQFSYFS